MKLSKIFFNLFVFTFLANSLLLANNQITLEKLWKERKFLPGTIKLGRSMNDGLRYSQVDNGKEINIYDYQTGDFLETAFSVNVFPDELEIQSIDNYHFSSDENMLLVAIDEEQIYRRSRKAKYYLWDMENKELSSLEEVGKQRIPTFSPDGKYIAFVRDNNIYLYTVETGKVQPVTKDGKRNHIINGTTDWVYEEEFYLVQGLYWSPDSENIAFYRFDEERVKEFNMLMYGELYPEEYRFKYPKAGEENAIVTIHIYNIISEETIDVDVGDPDNQYIPRIMWANNPDKLAVQRLNRHQNHLEILLADAYSGNTSVIYEEKNKYFISITDDLYFFEDGKHFLISSEKDGYNRVYLHKIDGSQVRALTPESVEVSKFFGINEFYSTGQLFRSCNNQND